jgi:lysophospholipase L1-like esterase
MLPAGSTYVNAGVSGSTVEGALAAQAPKVDEVHPTLATVWLNVNDILRNVSTETYEKELGDLVHRLRQGGKAKVLVANTPDVSHLPVVTACLTTEAPAPDGPRCPIPAFFRGPQLLDIVNRAVDAYNAAIGRIVAAEGAVLVDLHAASLQAWSDGTGPSLVSKDGFHPSTAGHAAVAATFARALAAA